MPDRIIRDELLQSDRWLDLPTDTHRLVYENMILIADDYGNIKGGPRRLFRWMHSFSQVKTEPDSIKLMSDLQDVDLVRRYEADGLEFWHLPRFHNSRRYWVRKWPMSPYEEQQVIPSKQRIPQNPNAHVPNMLRTTSGGVGVGVGEKQLLGSTDSPTRVGQHLRKKADYLYKKPNEL